MAAFIKRSNFGKFHLQLIFYNFRIQFETINKPEQTVKFIELPVASTSSSGHDLDEQNNNVLEIPWGKILYKLKITKWDYKITEINSYRVRKCDRCQNETFLFLSKKKFWWASSLGFYLIFIQQKCQFCCESRIFRRRARVRKNNAAKTFGQKTYYSEWFIGTLYGSQLPDLLERLELELGVAFI